MHDDDAITSLRDAAEPFVLDADISARLRARLDAYVADHVDPVAAAPIATRRRSRRAWLGTALAGAAVLLLVVAIGPSLPGSGTDDDTAPGAGSSRGVLLAAAEAAGDAPWHPLTPTEYHHVYASSFTPTIPPVDGMDDRQMSAGFTDFPSATESWIRPDGRGVVAQISGGTGNPEHYPEVGPDSNGDITGMSSMHGPSEVTDPAASIRYPMSVRTWSWLPDAAASSDTIWFRQPEGFLRGMSWPGLGLPISGLGIGERNMVRIWGDTYEDVAALDELSGDELERATIALLDGDPRAPLNEAAQEGEVGTFGLTTENARLERRIRRALQLLGSAPLAPHARQALFEWLAAQDEAKVEPNVEDELGRVGTRVTFERVFDEVVPAHDATLDELRATAIHWKDGPPPTVVEDAKATYPVPAHRAQRRWYVSFVFDPRDGELLELVRYTGHRTTKPIPQLVMSGYPPRDPYVWRVNVRAPFGIDSEAISFHTRARATDLQPDAAVCVDHPNVCR